MAAVQAAYDRQRETPDHVIRDSEAFGTAKNQMDILAAVSPHVAGSLALEALDAALGIGRDDFRTAALTKVVPSLPGEVVRQALAIAAGSSEHGMAPERDHVRRLADALMSAARDGF